MHMSGYRLPISLISHKIAPLELQWINGNEINTISITSNLCQGHTCICTPVLQPKWLNNIKYNMTGLGSNIDHAR